MGYAQLFLVKLLYDNKAQQKSGSREIKVEIEVLTYTFLKKTLEFLDLSSHHPWKFCKIV